MPARGDDGLVLFHLGHVAFLVRRQLAERLAHQCRKRIAKVEDTGEGECGAQQVRRAHHGDLGIAPDDDGVGVVAGMTPAPGHRIAHQHEAGDLVDDIVHPARAEGGAMAAFVPARVAGGAVEHAVDEEERHAPPGAPEINAAGSGSQDGGDPDDRVADRRTVGTLHQLLHRSCAAHRCDTTRPRLARSRSPSACFRRPGCNRASLCQPL